MNDLPIEIIFILEYIAKVYLESPTTTNSVVRLQLFAKINPVSVIIRMLRIKHR